MPKTRQKTRWAGGKRSPARKAEAATNRKAKAAEQTVEQLQAEITELVDLAEALMLKQPRPAFRLTSPHMFPQLEETRRLTHAKLWQLEKLLHPEGTFGRAEPTDVETWMEATFTDPKGAVPRWSRAGSFLLFLEYVPMLITWHGILRPDITAVAVDPMQPFIRNPQVIGKPTDIAKGRALPSPGYLGLGGGQVAPKMNSVADLACSLIADIDTNLVLRPLTEDAKQNVRDTLATEPWISEALKRGPEHRMPLPRHLHAIPQSLFG
jgi:hypothetical protein